MNPANNSYILTIVSWILQLLTSLILIQTLYFQLIGAEEYIYVFETVGLEPWGRYFSAIAELVAGIFLLIPRTVWMGALMALVIITFAIFFHITSLGLEVLNDGGSMFYLANTVFLSSTVILILRRQQIKVDGKLWTGKDSD